MKDLSNNCKYDSWSIIDWWCPNYGWNFEWNWAYNSLTAFLLENETYDINWHWTHVSWIIWAVWNNWTWVIWVTQNIELFSSRLETYDRSSWVFYVSNTVRALNFAIENWAKVVNASYGWGGFSQTEYNSIKTARDKWILFIAAAWNSANDNDINPFYSFWLWFR